MRTIRLAAVLALAVTLGSVLPVSTSTATVLEPLVVGWERIFKLQWEVGDRRGTPVVSGYLVNDSPYRVTAVRLLIDALDGSGTVVAQKIGWANAGTMEPFTRASFELPLPPVPAATYRLRVFAFDRVESDMMR